MLVCYNTYEQNLRRSLMKDKTRLQKDPNQGNKSTANIEDKYQTDDEASFPLAGLFPKMLAEASAGCQSWEHRAQTTSMQVAGNPIIVLTTAASQGLENGQEDAIKCQGPG